MFPTVNTAKQDLSRQRLANALSFAADWLVDVAQVKQARLTDEDAWHFRYNDWRGAIRGEYRASTRKWGFFCPMWHTGQAVKALLMAWQVLGRDKDRLAAELSAQFILRHQVWDPRHPDHGLLLAYEDDGKQINTSAILETMDGLLLLAELDDFDELRQRMIQAGRFVIERLYMPGLGLFRDAYDPEHRRVVLPAPYATRNDVGGRPLLDDAILIKLYHISGEKRFLDVATEVAGALVSHQRPPGNWVDYAPCDAASMSFHPRHTFWWGMPLLDVWQQTRQQSFLDTAMASAQFTRRAMRKDGGIIRGTYVDPASGEFNTDSFGHATSGSACAAIFFLKVWKLTQDPAWLSAAELALKFCMSMQVHTPSDANLRGVILEKVTPPDGTDASPYYVRDLGTIFFMQAAALYLQSASS